MSANAVRLHGYISVVVAAHPTATCIRCEYSKRWYVVLPGGVPLSDYADTPYLAWKSAAKRMPNDRP
ncbi:hypothetical protein VT84_13950 [Gemmata sp. SH-PL17]|nr:hypothetical protein VT84_13950 [Gemmata sp. SH-PL17]